MKKLIIPFAIILVFLVACQPAERTPPPVFTGDPVLAIGGEDLDDPLFADDSVEDIADPAEDIETVEDTVDDVSGTIDLPVKTVEEGDLVSFDNLQANDPDGDPVAFTFSEPLDEDGMWQTERGDAGEYIITISVSDGTQEATQDVLIIVESINKPPVLAVAPKEITVKEGDDVTIDARATDPNDDPVKITFSGWMQSSTRTATRNDIGTQTVTVTASDGESEVSETVTILVEKLNRAPDISPHNEITITEGDVAFVTPVARDSDGDPILYLFSEPLNENGVWETQVGDAGKYTAFITASDGELNSTTSVDITVLVRNSPPELTLADDDITVDEGETIMIAFETADADGDNLTITLSGFMTEPSYTTTFDDAGTHLVTVTADDGQAAVSKDVHITVNDVNRPPVFDKNAFT